MTRRPPARQSRKAPSKGKGQVKHSTTVRRGARGPVVHHEDHTEAVEVPVPPGEEEVGVGYDIKYWASSENHGMTMGTVSFVKLSCGPADLDHANDVAAELAYEYVQRNAKRVRRDLDKFIDGGK